MILDFNIIDSTINFFVTVKDQFLNRYIHGFSLLKFSELLMLIMGFVYIHLMVRENHYAWLIAAFNCFVLIFIWGSKGILGQCLLYIFYVGNALYAFYRWKKKDKNYKPVVKIKKLPLRYSLVQILGLGVLVYIFVYVVVFFKTNYGLVSNNTALDIFILVFSIYALLLQVNKYIESWLYFTLVDFLVFLLYIKLNLYILAIVRGYISVISLYGFFQWIKKYKNNKRVNK